MARTTKTEILQYGVRVLLSRHRGIRKLKRLHAPSAQGFRVWASTWLLIDFFKHLGLRNGTRVMEVGCGWGLAGIFCAKKHGAVVTSVDVDSQVFPYLRLHADINEVEITTMKRGFDALTYEDLKGVDVVIGADICFWDTLVDPLKWFICRAIGSGVRLVVIADPGRSTFADLSEYFIKNLKGEISDWAVESPYNIQGQILKIRPSNNQWI